MFKHIELSIIVFMSESRFKTQKADLAWLCLRWWPKRVDVAGARDLENHGGVPSHAGHTGHSPCRINPEVGRVSSVTFRLEFPNFYIVNFGKLLQQLPYNTGVYSCLHLILGLGTPPRESINVQLEELYALVTPWQCFSFLEISSKFSWVLSHTG